MGLFQLIIILVVIGVIMWLVNTYVPMSAGMKKVLNVVVLIVVILWLLQVFGVLGSIGVGNIRVGHIGK